MGGERFDTPQPESYLFGENGDLNFLGNRPTAVSLVFAIAIDEEVGVWFFTFISSFHILRRKQMNPQKH